MKIPVKQGIKYSADQWKYTPDDTGNQSEYCTNNAPNQSKNTTYQTKKYGDEEKTTEQQNKKGNRFWHGTNGWIIIKHKNYSADEKLPFWIKKADYG